MRMRLVFPAVAAAALVLASCASERLPAADSARGPVTGVELATLEIREDQIDRFEHCPPAGDIGQAWIPQLPEWHPPSASASAAVPKSAVDGSGGTSPQTASPEPDALPEASLATLVDEASTATRAAFRRCYHRGLFADPTQDGHVAVVLRVARSGKVAYAETWGACDLAPETLSCMRDEAAHVTLLPPEGGSATVTVPAVYTKGAGRRSSRNDAYAAAAYVGVEAVRPSLHRCEEQVRRTRGLVIATATMKLDVDSQGGVAAVAIDSASGGQDLVACAADALREARFPPPPAGRGLVIVPIVFNPRPGSR
jgi:hypothetical protein